MSLVPPAVAEKDADQVQPVNSGIWLDAHGYALISLGVSQGTAMGWVPYDLGTFGLVAIVSLLGVVVVVDRRRPA